MSLNKNHKSGRKENNKNNKKILKIQNENSVSKKGYIWSSIPIIIGILLALYYTQDIYKNYAKNSVDNVNNSETNSELKIKSNNEKINELKDSSRNESIDYRNYFDRIENNYKNEIKKLERMIEKNRLDLAKEKVADLLKLIPTSPRCLYANAVIMDKLSEIELSNDKLQSAINLYKKLFDEKFMKTIENKNLLITAGQRLVNRLQFYGKNVEAIVYNKKMCELFPEDTKLINDLGISYLIANKWQPAKKHFQETLDKTPNDPVALVHYGFILKQYEKRVNDSIEYLKRGIDTRDKLVMDSRFFFHLGDALQRMNQNETAYYYYEMAAKHGLFLSAQQRSVYNEPNLRAKPWWDRHEIKSYEKYFQLVEDNWKKIRDEAFALLNKKSSDFLPEDEDLRDTGDWKQFNMFVRGRKIEASCKKTPFTCSLIQNIPFASSCTRGQVKFSIMHPGTHVHPHCGPTNCRLRAHIGLKVPKGTYIRVNHETREWIEGKFIIFDDSFEHEVWHNGTEFRLVMIMDVWHPDLSDIQKSQLTPI